MPDSDLNAIAVWTWHAQPRPWKTVCAGLQGNAGIWTVAAVHSPVAGGKAHFGGRGSNRLTRLLLLR
jgi:hypothetical protein